MKILILILLTVFIISCASKRTFLVNNNEPKFRCGGFTFKSVHLLNLKDSVLIYGEVRTCFDSKPAPMSIVSVKNENLKVIKSIITDIKGHYRIKVISGSYSLYTANVAFGKIETGILDYLPGDSTNVNLFLADGEGLK